jgi:hypothetical protein
MAELVENLPATYPPEQYVSIHAEMAAGIYRSRDMVKVYLINLEGDVFGRPMGPPKAVPAGQLVMPTDGFVGMAIFLESYMQTLVETGVITKEQLQAKRNEFDNLRDA